MGREVKQSTTQTAFTQFSVKKELPDGGAVIEQTILKISNPESPYLVIATVGEKNFDLIEEGTRVRMESKVFDSMLEGLIYGRVTQVDPEGRLAQAAKGGGVNFEIEIEIEITPHPLDLGSSLDVYFMLGKRSLLKTLLGQPQKRRELAQ